MPTQDGALSPADGFRKTERAEAIRLSFSQGFSQFGGISAKVSAPTSPGASGILDRSCCILHKP